MNLDSWCWLFAGSLVNGFVSCLGLLRKVEGPGKLGRKKATDIKSQASGKVLSGVAMTRYLGIYRELTWLDESHNCEHGRTVRPGRLLSGQLIRECKITLQFCNSPRCVRSMVVDKNRMSCHFFVSFHHQPQRASPLSHKFKRTSQVPLGTTHIRVSHTKTAPIRTLVIRWPG